MAAAGAGAAAGSVEMALEAPLNKTQIGLKGLVEYLFDKDRVTKYVLNQPESRRPGIIRAILEQIKATQQCNKVIGKFSAGHTECWLCGYAIPAGDAVCEHVLPIAQAAIFWNIYNPDIAALKNSELVSVYNSYMSRLQDEYGWAHNTICNQVKTDKSFIRQNAKDDTLYVDEINIRNYVKEIGSKWRARMKGGGKAGAPASKVSKRTHTISKSHYKAKPTIRSMKATPRTLAKTGIIRTIGKSGAAKSGAAKSGAAKSAAAKMLAKTAGKMAATAASTRKKTIVYPHQTYDSHWERRRINTIAARYKSIVDYVNERGPRLTELSRVAMLVHLGEGVRPDFIKFIDSVPKDVPILESRVAQSAVPTIYSADYVNLYATQLLAQLKSEIKRLLLLIDKHGGKHKDAITIARHKDILITAFNISGDAPASIDDLLNKWIEKHNDSYIALYGYYYTLMTKMNIFIADVTAIHLFYIKVLNSIATRIDDKGDLAVFKGDLIEKITYNNKLLNDMMAARQIPMDERLAIMNILEMNKEQIEMTIKEHDAYAVLAGLGKTHMNLEK